MSSEIKMAPIGAKMSMSTIEAIELPPHDIEAEQGVMGCCFRDPDVAIPDCSEQCPPDSFYDLRNQAIAGAQYELHRRGTGIDPISVRNYLREHNHTEAVCDLPYLSALQDRRRPIVFSAYRFAHNAEHRTGTGDPILLSSYHPSQQNTSTGRLTLAMLTEVFQRARTLL